MTPQGRAGTVLLTLAAAAFAWAATTPFAHAQRVATGPSSSATPYVRPFAGYPADVYSVLTVGDSVNARPDGTPYRLVGIPDGMGSYLNPDGTTTLLVTHELAASAGGGMRRAHQPKGVVNGAFVSRWRIDPTPGTDFLRVLHGDDLITSTATVTNGTGGSLFVFNRFCSADLAPTSGLFNPATGRGTTERLFLTGEEATGPGRVIATGVDERVGVELVPFNPLVGAWENVCVRPMASDQTVVVALSDGNANRVFLYVGNKLAKGSSVARAGLLNGTGYGIEVVANGASVASESRDFCFGAAGKPRYLADFTLVPGNAGTSFLRPEDGAWDPANPSDFYFATADRLDSIPYGGTQVGRSRLFRLRFHDVHDVLAGGTIEALLDGTDLMNMGDNLTVFNDLAGGTRVIIQEDTGNNAHNSRHLLYTVATDTLEVMLECDPARFGDWGVPATPPFNVDEEVSGVVDARETLGLGWFWTNVQAHHVLPAELVRGGQLLAFFCPAAVGSCMADLSTPLDGYVDALDLAELLSSWGSAGRSDVNRDGTTDALDLAELLGAWRTP